MGWSQEQIDVVLVPSGFLVMFTYHLYLLYRCLKYPETTVIGYENHCRKAWTERVLQVEAKERGIYLTVISSTITAANYLASTSLALSSLIGAWVGSSRNNIFSSSIIYGNKSSSAISVKYISLLVCFLVAFVSFVQCVRYLVNASLLISMPKSVVPVSYVQKAVIRGNVFLLVGIRAIYFAINLLLWIFGPITMFLASTIMVVILHLFDKNTAPLHEFQSTENQMVYERVPVTTTTKDGLGQPHGLENKATGDQ